MNEDDTVIPENFKNSWHSEKTTVENTRAKANSDHVTTLQRIFFFDRSTHFFFDQKIVISKLFESDLKGNVFEG